ncbi:hypothetical protein WJX72_007150 [[Myrmecia] bisecta]|uniref:Fe2OG dioxygenase domain-containing protein n=1 Tax=[Myrmecia] bisecta TaxID=41462 RepID=A0AAW1R7W7_9CHLO
MLPSQDDATWTSAPADRMQPPAGRNCNKSAVPLQVSVIDMAQPEPAAAAQLREACTTTGFFYVSNHGVSDDLVQRQFAQWHQFFNLPECTKLALKAGKSNRGYYPVGAGSAKNPFGLGDRKEGFNIYGFESDLDLPFHGRNVWPDEAVLQGFKATMLQYYDAMHAVADRVLRLIALALDLPADWFADKFDKPAANIRCVHYVEDANDPDKGIFGVGAHTDWGMLTVLATDDVPGLQIHVNGEWVDVPPRNGTFIVNLGDMTHRWTNGRFRSTLHRVVKRDSCERYSSPFFLAPNWDAKIDSTEATQRRCESDLCNQTVGSASQYSIRSRA